MIISYITSHKSMSLHVTLWPLWVYDLYDSMICLSVTPCHSGPMSLYVYVCLSINLSESITAWMYACMPYKCTHAWMYLCMYVFVGGGWMLADGAFHGFNRQNRDALVCGTPTWHRLTDNQLSFLKYFFMFNYLYIQNILLTFDIYIHINKPEPECHNKMHAYGIWHA